MTAPAPSGGPSPLRIGGLALIGVGVVAGIIGLGTLASDRSSGNGSTAAPATSTSAPSEAAPAPAPTTSAAETPAPVVPVPSFGPTPTNALAAPTTAAAAAPAPAGGGGSVQHAPVRVYNNGTIHGLAARAADDFRAAGWPVDQVSNYPSGVIPTTTVYYRPGTDEQAAATALGDQFGMRVLPRFEGLADASPGIIVIITNDFKGR